MFVSRTCAACGNSDWNPFLQTETNRILTGDQRVLEGNISKSICRICGTVANSNFFSDHELNVLYGQDYELNIVGPEEHSFFTPSGPITRSEAFAQWVLRYLSKSFNSLLEVGCGQGNVLERLRSYLPEKKLMGIEGNKQASELARSKGLDVQQGLILGKDEKIPRADVFLVIAVIEHLEDISSFLTVLTSSLNSNGKIIFCLPVQNYPSYDVFFADHVWHFSVNQFYYLLNKNNLKVIHVDCDHPIIPGMCLFVCEVSNHNFDLSIPYEPNFITANRDHWLKVFRKIDTWLEHNQAARIAVFGGGEVLALFMAFTSLSSRQILACLDEDPLKVGTKRQGIEVQDLEWLKTNQIDEVLLTLNPKYHTQALKKLEAYGVRAFSYS